MKTYVVLFFMTLLSLPVVHAADPRVDIGEKFIQDRLQEQRIERQKNQSGVEVDIQKQDKDVADIFGPCFDVNTITVLGNDVVSTRQLNTLFKAYQGKCMSKALINRLLSDVNNYYVSEGYITSRAYLPRQDLTSGELKITVVEGVIEQIDINNNQWRDRWKLWWAMPAKPGEAMQLRNIEQGVDQLNRVSSGNAQLKLWPGESPGGSRIEILSEPQDEWRGRVSYDNDGSKSTGQGRLKLELEADNIISINDNWGLFLISSKDTNALAFNLGVPFRRWSFNYSYSYSEFLSFITVDSDLFGRTLTQSLSGDYLITRGAKGQTKATYSITHRNSRRTVLDTALTTQDFANARLGLLHSHRNNLGFWSFDAGVSKGLEAFGAAGDPPNISPDVPFTEFEKVDGSILFSGPVWLGHQWTSNIRGQYSKYALFSSEQIHIGDRSTVRGFRETSASGDYGAYWRNDLVMAWPQNWLRTGEEAGWLSRLWRGRLVKARPYAFVDTGVTKDIANERSNKLTGAGFGLRYREGRISFDASWGWGLLASSQSAKTGSELYLSASIAAF